MDKVEKLKELKGLLESGFISLEEANHLKTEIFRESSIINAHQVFEDYKAVKIYDQFWMAENLNVSHFRNGDKIPELKADEDWKKIKEEGTAGWCYYNNDPVNGKKYGKLYNWWAVNDPRGLAPEGWHVSSDDEWRTLLDNLGGEGQAGASLKEIGTKHWLSPNERATNSSGFKALPGGMRGIEGFNAVYIAGYWWCSTEMSQIEAWDRNIDYRSGEVYRHGFIKHTGLSVRCLRD
jgi:uncharacterized protein (TIGR02145 family)